MRLNIPLLFFEINLMKLFFFKFSLLLFALSLLGCKKNDVSFSSEKIATTENQIYYAKGFSIYQHKGFSIVKVSNPWPKANKEYTYILKEKDGIVPDSLQQFTTIQVPLQSIHYF